MCLIKFLVIGLLVALMGLFFYSMPVRLTLTKYNKVTRKLSSCMGKRVGFKRNMRQEGCVWVWCQGEYNNLVLSTELKKNFQRIKD